MTTKPVVADYSLGHTTNIEMHLALMSCAFMDKEKYDPKKQYLITVEEEKSNISRQMQKFYFGYLIEVIKDWNIETGIFCYEGTETTIIDKDEIDYILREFFFCKKVSVKDRVIKIPKTLKLTKANMKECCNYFDTLIRFFAEKDCFINTYDFR